MKGKLLLAALVGTLLVGSNVFASVARQAVMGNQPIFVSKGSGIYVNTVNGSLWYDDDYNVFYNPAYVNENKNYAVLEKGIEGGFFKSEFENFVYGVYMNRGNGAAAGSDPANMVAPGLAGRSVFTGANFSTMRPFDFFFGGDTGIKWGLHVAWAYNRDQNVATQPDYADAERTARYWHFDFGAEVMGLEPFVGATVLSKYQDNSVATPATQDLNEFNVGARYKYEGWSPYVVYHKYRESGLATGAAIQTQARTNVLGVGVGHDTKLADGVHFIKHVGLFMASTQDDNGNAANLGTAGTDQNKDFKDTIVPINVALEADVTSWLTLRGGAVVEFIANRKFATSDNTQGTTTAVNDKNISLSGSPKVRLGSTLKFGKLNIDSAFGNGTAATEGTSTVASNIDKNAIGFDSQLFGLVSASYHW